MDIIPTTGSNSMKEMADRFHSEGGITKEFLEENDAAWDTVQELKKLIGNSDSLTKRTKSFSFWPSYLKRDENYKTDEIEFEFTGTYEEDREILYFIVDKIFTETEQKVNKYQRTINDLSRNFVANVLNLPEFVYQTLDGDWFFLNPDLIKKTDEIPRLSIIHRMAIKLFNLTNKKTRLDEEEIRIGVLLSKTNLETAQKTFDEFYKKREDAENPVEFHGKNYYGFVSEQWSLVRYISEKFIERHKSTNRCAIDLFPVFLRMNRLKPHRGQGEFDEIEWLNEKTKTGISFINRGLNGYKKMIEYYSRNGNES